MWLCLLHHLWSVHTVCTRDQPIPRWFVMPSMFNMSCSKRVENLGLTVMMWLVYPWVIGHKVHGHGRGIGMYTTRSTTTASTAVPSVVVCMLWDIRMPVMVLVHEGAIRQQLLRVAVTR